MVSKRDDTSRTLESTSGWFQTSKDPRVVECGSLNEIDTNVNLIIRLKERLEAPLNYILKYWWKLIFHGVKEGTLQQKVCLVFNCIVRAKAA